MLPVSWVCERAVKRGCLGRWGRRIIGGSILWRSGLVLTIGGHGAKASKTNGEPVVASWSSWGLPIESCLGLEIGIHLDQTSVTVTHQSQKLKRKYFGLGKYFRPLWHHYLVHGVEVTLVSSVVRSTLYWDLSHTVQQSPTSMWELSQHIKGAARHHRPTNQKSAGWTMDQSESRILCHTTQLLCYHTQSSPFATFQLWIKENTLNTKYLSDRMVAKNIWVPFLSKIFLSSAQNVICIQKMFCSSRRVYAWCGAEFVCIFTKFPKSPLYSEGADDQKYLDST